KGRRREESDEELIVVVEPEGEARRKGKKKGKASASKGATEDDIDEPEQPELAPEPSASAPEPKKAKKVLDTKEKLCIYRQCTQECETTKEVGELVVSEHLNLLDAKKHIVVSVDAGDHVQRYHARKADRDVEWVVFRFQKTKLAINWTVLGRPKDSDGPLARFSVADVIRITKADHGATSKDRAALLEIEDARAAHKIEQAKIELRNMANAKKKSKAPRAVVPRAPTPASSGVSPADMAFWRKTFEAE